MILEKWCAIRVLATVRLYVFLPFLQLGSLPAACSQTLRSDGLSCELDRAVAFGPEQPAPPTPGP